MREQKPKHALYAQYYDDNEESDDEEDDQKQQSAGSSEHSSKREQLLKKLEALKEMRVRWRYDLQLFSISSEIIWLMSEMNHFVDDRNINSFNNSDSYDVRLLMLACSTLPFRKKLGKPTMSR